MKRTTRIFAIALALVTVMAMSLTFVSAVDIEKPGRITIDNAVSGATYRIYRILDFERVSDTTGVYRKNETWGAFVDAHPEFFKVDDNGYVTYVEDADVKSLAAAAIAWANRDWENPVQPETTQKVDLATPPAPPTTNNTVTFTGLPLGYYLVDTSVGTLCSLNTTNEQVIIKDKNVLPPIEKKVKEDSTGNWGTENDAEIGETVEFRVTIEIPQRGDIGPNAPETAGAEHYFYHDKMSDGLTLDNTSVVIKFKSGETTTDVAADKYLLRSGAEAGPDTFNIVFADEGFIDTVKPGDVITIDYKATVNDQAVIAGEGNPNECYLQYGEMGEFKTAKKTTKTYVWNFDILKFAMEGEPAAEKVLPGAEFTLSEGDRPLKFDYIQDKGIYRLNMDSQDPAVLTSNDQGEIKIEGLDSGTYTLKETKAPEGYTLLTDTIAVKIDGNGQVNEQTDVKTVKVLNTTGSLMPNTGAGGTIALVVVGALLVIGAGILLATKKQMSAFRG